MKLALALLTLCALAAGARAEPLSIRVTADNRVRLYVAEQLHGSAMEWTKPIDAQLYAVAGDVVAISAVNDAPNIGGSDPAGLLAHINFKGQTYVTNSAASWKCLSAAQLSSAPAGWKSNAFDDSAWVTPVQIAQNGAGVWGADTRGISATAQWIWTSDLGANPALFCRFKLPRTTDATTVRMTADNEFTLHLNGVQLTPSPAAATNVWNSPANFATATTGGDVLAVAAINAAANTPTNSDPAGLLAHIVVAGVTYVTNSRDWKCTSATTNTPPSGWTSVSFNDAAWESPREVAANNNDISPSRPWGTQTLDISTSAYWVWTNDNGAPGANRYMWCRFRMPSAPRTARPVTDAIAKQFAPVIQFAPWEKLWPVSIDFLLQNARLRCRSMPDVDILNPTQADLAAYHSRWNVSDCYVDIDSSRRSGMPPQNNRIVAPMYWTQQVYPNFIEINYAMLYARNGAQTVRLYTQVLGSHLYDFNAQLYDYATHDGDLEHVTVRITKDMTKILSLGAWSHGDVKYLSWNTATSTGSTTGTRPLFRSALNSHGSYHVTDGAEWHVLQRAGEFEYEQIGVNLVSAQADLIDITMFSNGNVNPTEWRPFEGAGSLVQVGLDDGLAPVNAQPWAAFAGRLGRLEDVGFVYCRDVNDGLLSNTGAGLPVQALCDYGGAKIANQVPEGLRVANGPTGLASNPWAKGTTGPALKFLQPSPSATDIAVSGITPAPSHPGGTAVAPGWPQSAELNCYESGISRPSVLYTGDIPGEGAGAWRMYFRDEDGTMTFTSKSVDGGWTWSPRVGTGMTASSSPKAFIAGGKVRFVARDGAGNAMLAYEAATGASTFVPSAAANADYNMGIDCGSEATVAVHPDGGWAVVCCQQQDNRILLSHRSAAGIRTRSAVSPAGFIGLVTVPNRQPLILYSNNAWHLIFSEINTGRLRHYTNSASVPTAGWSPVGTGYVADMVSSAGPGGFVFADRLHLFFRDPSGNGLFHGSTGVAGQSPQFDSVGKYMRIDCGGAADAACGKDPDASTPLCMAVCRDFGGSGVMVSRMATWMLQP